MTTWVAQRPSFNIPVYQLNDRTLSPEIAGADAYAAALPGNPDLVDAFIEDNSTILQRISHYISNHTYTLFTIGIVINGYVLLGTGNLYPLAISLVITTIIGGILMLVGKNSLNHVKARYIDNANIKKLSQYIGANTASPHDPLWQRYEVVASLAQEGFDKAQGYSAPSDRNDIATVYNRAIAYLVEVIEFAVDLRHDRALALRIPPTADVLMEGTRQSVTESAACKLEVILEMSLKD